MKSVLALVLLGLVVACTSQPPSPIAIPATTVTAAVSPPATETPATPSATEARVPTEWPADARIAIADASATESDPSVRVPVMLNMPLSADLAVPFVVASISAVDGREFTTHDGTVTIPAGAIGAEIPVDLLDDATNERKKVFLVEIRPPIRATRLAGLAYVADDDPEPTVTVDSATARRSDGSIRFTLTLSNPSDFPVTVRYATRDGTARHGHEYLAQTARIAGSCPVIEVAAPERWGGWSGGWGDDLGIGLGSGWVMDGLTAMIPCGVQFPRAVTSMTVEIALLPGASATSNQTLQLHLVDAANAQVGTTDAIGTILADD